MYPKTAPEGAGDGRVGSKYHFKTGKHIFPPPCFFAGILEEFPEVKNSIQYILDAASETYGLCRGFHMRLTAFSFG